MTVAPDQIADLAGWWKADDLAGLADGAPVASWPDAGPNGLTMTPAAGGPTYAATGINGLPAVHVDGNSWLSSLGIVYGPEVTVVAVVTPSGLSGYGGVYAADMSTASSSLVCFASSATSTSWKFANSSLTGDTWPQDEPRILLGEGNQLVYVDGARESAGAQQGISTTGTAFYLGSSAGTQNFAGYIAEVILYTRNLNAGERVALDNYLSDKYGISVADHRIAPPSLSVPLVHDYDAGVIESPVAGDPVKTLPDPVGLREAIQTTSSAQPTLQQATVNGKTFWALRFDGVNDKLTDSSFALMSEPGTVVLIMQMAAGTSGYVLDGGGATRWAVGPGVGGTATDWRAYAGSSLTTGVENDGAPHVHTVFFDTNDATYHLDGVLLKGPLDIGSMQMSSLFIGSRQSSASFFNGYIARLFYFGGAFTDTDRATLDSWVQDTYGIAVADYQPSGGTTETHSGSGSMLASFTATASGTKQATGSGSAPLIATTAGEGVKSASGSGSVPVTLKPVGSGGVLSDNRSGAGSIRLTVTTSGAGVKKAHGTGAVATALSTSGGGTKQTAGAGSAKVRLVAAGAGAKRATGSGACLLHVKCTGTGLKAAVGSGTVPVLLVVDGHGRMRGVPTPRAPIYAQLSGRTLTGALSALRTLTGILTE